MGVQFWWFYDVIAVATILICLFITVKRGFLKAAVSLLGYVLALFIALSLSSSIGSSIYSKSVRESNVKKMDQALSENEFSEELAKYLESHEDEFAELLAQKTNADMIAEQKHLEAELNKAIARNGVITNLFSKTYEDNVSGKLSDEMFMELSHKYEVERMKLKERIQDCRERLAKIGEMKQNKDDFIRAVRKFMEMETLTAPMLRELIDHIDVFEKEGGKKSYTQRIVIYYRFVGFIEIPKKAEDENYKADKRLDVEMEYIPAKSA